MAIYLDNAATTYPKPPEVYENTFRFMREAGGNPGRGAHSFSNASSQVIEETRRKVAQLFGIADFHRVIFTHNCTDSLNIVLKGYLREGDHVIATNLDHNSVSRPLESLVRKRRIHLTRIPFDDHGRVDPQSVRAGLQNNTTLIVLTHGSNVLGSVQPLNAFVELARERGVPLLLDAAQTAGRIPLALGDAPVFAACSAHKGLFAMPGLGILTLPPNILPEHWREGGSGTASESLEHPLELPMRFEAGTPNFLAVASLNEALNFLNRVGIEAIHKREMQLAGKLSAFLMSDARFIVYSKRNELAVVSFNVKGAPAEEVAGILDHTFEIAVRAGLHCAAVLHAQLGTQMGGCVRVSPGYFNTMEEIDTLIAALRQIADSY